MGRMKKFDETAQQVLNLMKDTISAKTFFVATTQDERFRILQTINQEGGCSIPAKVDAPLSESYCGKVVHDSRPLLIKNSLQSDLVNNMQVTYDFSIGSYLGVPITFEDGTTFGTLCALDPSPYVLEERDIKKLEGYAKLIANSLELEKAFLKLQDYELQTKKEFQLARNVQRSVISKPYKDAHIEIDSIYTPSFHLSGDVCTWYKIKENLYGVIVLDVMGHGVSSALIGMALHASLKDIIMREVEPFEVMNELNQVVLTLFEDDSNMVTFVTGIYTLIDFNIKTVRYMNAGHPPGLVIHSKHHELLDRGSMPLGIYPQLTQKTGEVSFESADEILLYSDGLTDFLYTEKESAAETMAREHSTAKKENQTTISHFSNYVHSQSDHADDICLVSIKLKR
ncbi:serine phosphatase RsbU [Halalkalibacter wakoensis JCM 9140]|uniref:Serine phosphatase RsbU n=1 Tax=Halalkalibacter wakoensis JCM 9140 TaxID=1236970 RepID=W4PZU7_9BACI|nr:GAF domain-containing SpoIIE family protein phosphatase [Halalkalibacter wakoensis]GAE24963.1 serine phosphatase RsbU [Halalkalibacter wakoensis JCM 9140]